MDNETRARFESKYCPEPNTGCWLWTGSHFDTGYGQFHIRRSAVGAHRVSYEIHHGTIRDGLWVLHRCDTPACVNPDHLFLGTHADARGDRNGARLHPERLSRGAQHYARTRPDLLPRGEQHGMSRLTMGAAAAIRSRYAAGSASQRQLAREYGVSQTTIYRVIRGDIWNPDDRSHAR